MAVDIVQGNGETTVDFNARLLRQEEFILKKMVVDIASALDTLAARTLSDDERWAIGNFKLRNNL